MADLFDTYEADFALSHQEANLILSQVESSAGEHRKSLLREAQVSIDDCAELLEQMNIEVQGIPLNSRSPFNQKVRQHRQETNDMKANLRRLEDAQDKLDLFGDRYSDQEPVDAGTREQRRQLLENQLSIDRSLQRLLDSQRIALETENVGSNILNDLRSQREQITGARDTLQLADGYVDKLIKSLKTMSRRITANKFISYAIIGVLILLILLVLASKFW